MVSRGETADERHENTRDNPAAAPVPARAAELKISPNGAESLPPNWEGAPEDSFSLRDLADWTKFRSLETLGQKAGVPRHRIVQTVGKELADNALDQLDRDGLDPADHCRLGLVGTNGFFVENGGTGMTGTDEEIAALFSISRPYRSSKLVRTITRGALGNGLRVVAGAVLCGGGYVLVETRGRLLRLEPQHHDGRTRVTRLGASHRPGTRVPASSLR